VASENKTCNHTSAAVNDITVQAYADEYTVE